MKIAAVAVALAALLSVPASALAQNAPAPAPKPCAAPEYRQFDFWIGQWDVFNPAGKLVGHSRIEPFAGGCALLENWSSLNPGGDGKSINIYDATDKRWHQSWADASGSRLLIEGGLANGSMVMSAGTGTVQRITWTPLAGGAVRQHWEISQDGGRTWTTSFDGKYVKHESQ